MEINWRLIGGLCFGMFVFNMLVGSCNSEPETEEVLLPTTGLITTLQEVQQDLFKISDEEEVPETDKSLVIANYMDSTSDTFTLQQIKLMQVNGGQQTGRSSGIMTAASFGLMGYMMGRSMRSPIRSSAYMDQKTYNKVNKNAGANMRRTATRTTRTKPSSGKSGFGSKSRSSGGSTRSYGG